MGAVGRLVFVLAILVGVVVGVMGVGIVAIVGGVLVEVLGFVG